MVAGGPTPEWGGGGMAGVIAAAALRLPLAPSVTGNMPRPSPPRLGWGSVHGLGRQRAPPKWGATGVGCAAPGGDGMPTETDADAQAKGGEGAGSPGRPPATLPVAPGAGYVGLGGGLSTGGLPPGMGSGAGPSMWQEGVYTPTAHEGAPQRGDGPGPLSMADSRPGGGRGLHSGVGRWRDGARSSRCGVAAVPRGGRSQGSVRGLPPPPQVGGRERGQQGAPTNPGLARMESTSASCHPVPPSPPPPLAHCPGPPVTCREPLLSMAQGPPRRGRGRRRGHSGVPPLLPRSRRRHHGLALLRWWYGQAAQVLPAPHQRRGWASTTCALAPSRGYALGSCTSRASSPEWVVAHPPPARGRPCLAVQRPGPR